MIMRWQLKTLLVSEVTGVGHAIGVESSMKEYRKRWRQLMTVVRIMETTMGSYEYLDNTMGMGETSQNSQSESDLGDSNISL